MQTHLHLRTKISKWLYFQTLPQSGQLLTSTDLWSLLLSPSTSLAPAAHTTSPSLNSYRIYLLFYRKISYICYCLDCVDCIVTYHRCGRMMYWNISLNLFSCICPSHSYSSPAPTSAHNQDQMLSYFQEGGLQNIVVERIHN